MRVSFGAIPPALACALSLSFARHTTGFTTTMSNPTTARGNTALSATVLAPAKQVHILPTEEDVSKAVHAIVENAAKSAIADRGHFALAIPGGSVLKVLSSLEPSPLDGSGGETWASKTTVAFVNHKCVPIDDVSSAIEAQAREKFLERWGVLEAGTVSLDGTADAAHEASEYEAKLRALPATTLPRGDDGFPVFDLAIVGVGDDGHIGSLYPNRGEVEVTDGPWTVGATMKDPPSISLTLPVMQAARLTVISAAGQSVKYPNGKAEAMRRAVVDGDATPQTFPACALRECALWIFDEPNGSLMEMELSTVEKAVADAA